jgi:hypothetical protein
MKLKGMPAVEKLKKYLGMGKEDDSDDYQVPTVFCYSLFYVYYD